MTSWEHTSKYNVVDGKKGCVRIVGKRDLLQVLPEPSVKIHQQRVGIISAHMHCLDSQEVVKLR
jgi:hypothetical protein